MKYAVKIFLLVGLLTWPCLLVAQEDTTTYEYYEEEQDTEAEIVLVSPEALHSAKKYKTETVTIRKFNADQWKSVVGTTNFEEELEKPQEASPSGRTPWNSGILQIISYLVIFIIIGFIVYFIIQNTSMGTKKVKNEPRVNDLTAPIEDIEEIDLTTLLERALSGGDLRLVIRAHYLILLHTLHESGNIAWKKNKTNLDYLLELLSRDFYYEEVRYLTRAYETIWYGEQPLTTVVYEQLVADFKKINHQLNLPKPA